VCRGVEGEERRKKKEDEESGGDVEFILKIYIKLFKIIRLRASFDS
jgi:hypothetical protein